MALAGPETSLPKLEEPLLSWRQQRASATFQQFLTHLSLLPQKRSLLLPTLQPRTDADAVRHLQLGLPSHRLQLGAAHHQPCLWVALSPEDKDEKKVDALDGDTDDKRMTRVKMEESLIDRPTRCSQGAPCQHNLWCTDRQSLQPTMDCCPNAHLKKKVLQWQEISNFVVFAIAITSIPLFGNPWMSHCIVLN